MPIVSPLVVGGSSYTTTGPSSGSVGVASSNFTVALPTGAGFLGDQTITLSDGSNGGTFTPSVGSPGTSTVTVTPSLAATGVTFTYTPATGGTKTLTMTNAQDGWIDPSPISYLAGSSSTAQTVLKGVELSGGVVLK